MKNIWKVNREASANVKRNNFDLSFVSHSTFKFGYLYPVFKRKVYPGDSFKITSAFDLKMMPVEFPVQSRMRAHMHYFYVKNKNLWDNWEDWINGLRTNVECPHPHIDIPDTEFSNGSIHDFLGQPTSVVSSDIEAVYKVDGPSYRSGAPLPRNYEFPFFSIDYLPFSTWVTPSFSSNLNLKYLYFLCNFSPRIGDVVSLTDEFKTFLNSYNITDYSLIVCESFDINVGSAVNPQGVRLADVSLGSDIVLSSNFVSRYNSLSDPVILVGFPFTDSSLDWNALRIPYDTKCVKVHSVVPQGFTEWSKYAEQHQTNIFTDQILLDALPYRAYESIYRAYYANDILQPLVIDGRKEYNKFITNSGDGNDGTDYHLFRRNYEYDFLTSAFPSPQAGAAPLVGINQLGEVTIEDENGITTGQAVLDSEGHVTDIVVTSPLASVEHGRTAMNIAQLGMSINDFRNANALQRLKERFLRGGFRYKPWKKAVWGVTSSDDTLDMPIFIGGYSRDVNISPIYSQANTLTSDGGSSLGEWAGVGRCIGGSTHDIQHFFDDYGWVIGILCITPTPAYSQLLPKENLCPTNYLDYYFPDMAQLGMQPITYKEVAPLQSYIDSLADPSKRLEDTFGYQRPNYDMVASVDEVHGEFRGSLRNQVINRIFDHRPELGTEFLEVNPSEINDIFINQNPDDDVFIGHVAFRIFSKRPLPRVHIPGLGF